MTPQQRNAMKQIMEMIDKHPDHRSVDAILRCQFGCAQRLHEHLDKITRLLSRSEQTASSTSR